MIKLPLKFRIKRLVRRPITSFFYKLSHNQSCLLKIGFVEKLRRKWAPTYKEQRQDIIDNSASVVRCVRELVEMERLRRKIMPPMPIPDTNASVSKGEIA